MSVSRRGKSWQVRWVNSAGKRCSATFAKKALAEEYERKQKSMAHRQEIFDPKNTKVTVGEVRTLWLQSKSKLKPKTLQGYESTWRNVVEPTWGNVQLRSITHGAVRTWVATCTSVSGHRLGYSKTREAYYLLTMILDHAVNCELIERNHAKPRDGDTSKFLPQPPKNRERNFLTETELRDVAQAAGHYRDLILLLGTVGLRFNEACGLKGEDLDLTENVIIVRRTLSDISGKILEQAPKNGEPRKVPLPEFLRDSLRERKLAAGRSGYVFTTPEGHVIRHSNFSRRVWRPALKVAQIDKHVTIHDLRGTAASWLIHRGATIMELSRMLGHSDASITLKRYGHLYDEAMNRLGKAIDEAGRVFA